MTMVPILPKYPYSDNDAAAINICILLCPCHTI
jgi:hypothetical protein